MGVAIDIIFCLLILLIVVKHTVKGFVKSLFGALKLILAALVAFIFTPMIFELSDHMGTAAAYLLTFSASYVIIAILAFIVEKFFELPLLKVANKLLGFALGAACAYVALSIFSSALSLLLSISAEQLFGQSPEEIANSTYIYRFFLNSGLFPNG